MRCIFNTVSMEGRRKDGQMGRRLNAEGQMGKAKDDR